MFDKELMNNISRKDFAQLKEEDVKFITTPGRMGDVDGITFIIFKNGKYIIYRINGWMYGDRTEESITLDDAFKQFPEWINTWNNWAKEDYSGKYEYIYMGFGNGLCIDKKIYKRFNPYLLAEAEKNPEYQIESKRNSIYYSCWKEAFLTFVKNEKNETI